MKNKIFTVLAGALMLFGALSTFPKTACANWDGNIWVEGDTLFYAEEFASKPFFPKAWVLRTADRRFYWNDYSKQWEAGARINMGVVEGYEYTYPLNKVEVDCPNKYEYLEYSAPWATFAKRFGFKVKSKYLPLIEKGDVYLGEKTLFKPWKKYIKDKKGKRIQYALGIIEHEYTTELWTDCGGGTPKPYCGDGDCNGDENWQTCSRDCLAPPSDCPLVSISNNIAYLEEGFKLNGQLDFDSPWYDQFADSQNRVFLDCDYPGEVLEFSVCFDLGPGCPAPCYDDFPNNIEYGDDPNDDHYFYVCQ